MYRYYYFTEKKERNAFIDDVDRRLKGGVYAVHIANDVALESTGEPGFVAVLTGGEGSVWDAVRECFNKFDSRRNFGEGGSPYDF